MVQRTIRLHQQARYLGVEQRNLECVASSPGDPQRTRIEAAMARELGTCSARAEQLCVLTGHAVSGVLAGEDERKSHRLSAEHDALMEAVCKACVELVQPAPLGALARCVGRA